MTSLPLGRRGRASLAAGAVALLLGACAGSPATRYYTLAPVAPAAPPSAYTGPPIEVRAVQVPPALDRLELLQSTGPGEVRVLDFDHWAAPLERLSQQVLAEDLAQRLPANKVASSGTAWPPQRAALAINILAFEHAGGTARMTLAWSLRAPPTADADAGAAPVGAMLHLSTPTPDDGAATTASAYANLLAQAADQITLALPR